MTDCGPNKESCCISLEVPGGTFSTFPGAVPSSISTFRLDKYDVTVGRFRQFVAAWYGAGWTPAAGSGKHVHVNGGQGLVNLDVAASAGTVYEPGWLPSDDSSVAPLDTTLVGAASAPDDTWTAVVSTNENLPLNGVSWYEAYAFCIWDGGFLPSQVEWEYAASGGDEQRTYPWGETDPGTANAYAIYADPMNNCYYPTLGRCDFNNVTNIAPVGTASAGGGRWGQLDLSGNVMQWSLDFGPPHMVTAPPIVCVDCVYFLGDDYANLGGYFYGPKWELVSSGLFVGGAPTNRDDAVGFRCARTP
jgi:formylglycine-generating enzyme required for sulfatase activity